HVDRRDRMRGERIVVDAATSEQAAVDLRVQRLDAPVHDLGKPRDLRDLGDGQRRVAKRSRRASGRDQLERQIEQSSCELDDPALVGNAQQCTTIRLHHETSIADELVALQLLAQGTAIDAENLRRAALVAVRIGQDRLEKWLLYLTDDELIQIAGLVSVQALEIALQRLIRERAERFYSSVCARCGRDRFFRFLFRDPLFVGWCLHDVLPTERVSTHGYSALLVVLALPFRGMGNENRPDMKPGTFDAVVEPCILPQERETRGAKS